MTARDALLHARLRIEARASHVLRRAPMSGAFKPAEAKREMTHEEWLEVLG